MFKKKPRSNSASKGEGVPRTPPRLPDTPPPTQPPPDYHAELQRSVNALNTTLKETDFQQVMDKGAVYAAKAEDLVAANEDRFKYVTETAKKGYDFLTDGKLAPLTDALLNNPALQAMIHIADQLVDIGKTVPFVAPAFSILKVIIDIEKKAREADAKCTDLLERINFMVSHLTTLEKIRIMETTKLVIQKMERVLKDAASLIGAYRKQGPISRRLNMGNKDRFVASATSIQSCCSDLMISLQIQSSGQLDILTRDIPVDPEDQVAQLFISQNGGPDQIRRNPELVKQFASRVNLTVDDSVMRELNTSIGDMMQQNQIAIESMLKQNVSAAVVDGIKGLAAQMNEFEKEEKYQCVQCGEEYRESTNGTGSCSFHAGSENDGRVKTYSCCGQTEPCQHRPHRSKHHCEYPYTRFFPRASNVLNYTDTTDVWAISEERDLETNNEQKVLVGQLLRWVSRGAMLSEPTIIIRVGTVWHGYPYFFSTFTKEELEAINRKKAHWSQKSLIFRTVPDESAYAMAEWALDSNGIIVGVRVSTKVTSSDSPTVIFVPIDSTTCTKSGDIQTLSKGGLSIYKPVGTYTLPETIHVGSLLRDGALRKPRIDFKTRSDLTIPVILMAASDPPLRANPEFANTISDTFFGSISVFNKAAANSNTPLTIASATAAFRLIGDETYTPVKAVEFLDFKFPFTVDPRQSFEMKFKAVVPRTEEDIKLDIKWWDRAVVARKRPLRLKLTLKDIEGDECSLVLEYVFSTFPQEKLKDSDLGFFYIDDHERCSRYAIHVTPSGSGVITIGSKDLSAEDLTKIVYEARKSGETEVDMNINYEGNYGAWEWNAWALLDLNCQRVYAFKVLVNQGKLIEKKTRACMGYVLCPEYGEATESRPIKYATEKIKFPTLEQETEETLPEDDLVDEWVPEPEKPKEAVLPNGTGVGMGGGVFVMPEALERRLASIDENLARTATAVESLVMILAKMMEKETAEPQVL